MKVTVIVIVILLSGSSRVDRSLPRTTSTLLHDEGGEEAGDRDPAGQIQNLRAERRDGGVSNKYYYYYYYY